MQHCLKPAIYKNAINAKPYKVKGNKMRYAYLIKIDMYSN